MTQASSSSVAGLVRSAMDDVRELFREELALAKAEVREEFSKLAAGSVSASQWTFHCTSSPSWFRRRNSNGGSNRVQQADDWWPPIAEGATFVCVMYALVQTLKPSTQFRELSFLRSPRLRSSCPSRRGMRKHSV